MAKIKKREIKFSIKQQIDGVFDERQILFDSYRNPATGQIHGDLHITRAIAILDATIETLKWARDHGKR